VDLGSIEVTSRNGVRVVALLGEHDLADAEDVRAALSPASSSALVVDLSPATFIDSQILNVLVTADNDAERAGHRLAVVCPEGSNIRHVLEVTGLAQVLACHPDLASALGALGQGD
jgi:anti-anti-sigma factor